MHGRSAQVDTCFPGSLCTPMQNSHAKHGPEAEATLSSVLSFADVANLDCSFPSCFAVRRSVGGYFSSLVVLFFEKLHALNFEFSLLSGYWIHVMAPAGKLLAHAHASCMNY